jgi:hypothetical protein
MKGEKRMSNYSSDFLHKRRVAWMNSLGKFQTYENGVWSDVVVNQMSVSGSDIIAYVYAANKGKSGTISKVRVYDKAGSLAAEWNVSVERSSVQNVLLKIVLPIEEV